MPGDGSADSFVAAASGFQTDSGSRWIQKPDSPGQSTKGCYVDAHRAATIDRFRVPVPLQFSRITQALGTDRAIRFRLSGGARGAAYQTSGRTSGGCPEAVAYGSGGVEPESCALRGRALRMAAAISIEGCSQATRLPAGGTSLRRVLVACHRRDSVIPRSSMNHCRTSHQLTVSPHTRLWRLQELTKLTLTDDRSLTWPANVSIVIDHNWVTSLGSS